ncbi:MAG: TRAP transporter large permease subunit [Bilophila wadsworthia]
MNHEQAMLMKSSRVSDLNTPGHRCCTSPPGASSQAAHHRRFEYGIALFLLYPFGTVRLAYVGANGEERTILYAGAGTLMNVPTIIAGDIKNTVVTCTERVEAAIFDAGLLTDRAFAAAHPDLLLNLIHSLCRMGLPRHERHHQQRREGHQRPRPALHGQVPPHDGNRPALPAHPGDAPGTHRGERAARRAGRRPHAGPVRHRHDLLHPRLFPAVPLLLICVPIFVPIAKVFGWDLIWFGVIITVLDNMASITPPSASASSS